MRKNSSILMRKKELQEIYNCKKSLNEIIKKELSMKKRFPPLIN